MGIKLFAQRYRRIGQYLRRDSNVNQLAGSPREQRPIANSKEAEAEIGEPAASYDRLRRQTDNGIVAMAAGELMKEVRGICPYQRQLDGEQ